MYNPGEDDNELDRLSREAASGYKAPGNPDWDAMQDRLDKVMPQDEKKRRPLLFWILIPALLLGGAGYFALTERSAEKGSIAENHAVAKTSKIEDKQVAAPGNDIPAAAPKEIPAENIDRLQAPAAHGSSNEPANNVAALKIRLMMPVVSASSPLSTTNDINKDLNKDIDAEVNKELVTAKASEPLTIAKADQPETTTVPSITVEPAQKENAAETAVVTTQKRKQGKAWSIGLLGSIDESTVKFKYGYEPGYGLGLMAGYHFNNTFSIYTGAVYTQKNYKMDGGDFTAPKGSWPSYYKLETVEGYCRMWEVPLLARFYTSHTDKKGFFLSTGLSSYFMNHENYTYGYHFMGQPATKTLDYTTSTTHVLSVAHFSVGFESRVGNNLYLQIEPYAKVPLGGVGTGKIELSSFGMNVGIQFRKPSKN